MARLVGAVLGVVPAALASVVPAGVASVVPAGVASVVASVVAAAVASGVPWGPGAVAAVPPSAAAGSPVCPGGPDRCHGRAVVEAGDGGFDLGLYYAGPDGAARRVDGTGGGCPDCAWQVTAACDGTRPAEAGAPVRPEPNCRQASVVCPAGRYSYVWLRRPGDVWRRVDAVCVTAGGRLSTLRDLAADVAAAFRHLPLPAPVPRLQPGDRAVVGLPLIAYALPEPPHRTTLRLEGFAVTLTATTDQWRWGFGDGSPTVSVREPGRPHPDPVITHRYLRPGSVVVAVTCVWRGRYRVAGVPTAFPVDAAVERAASRRVAVGEARAELVGSR